MEENDLDGVCNVDGSNGNACPLISSNLYEYFRRPNLIREADVKMDLKTAAFENTH
jgi:hypothetical protein